MPEYSKDVIIAVMGADVALAGLLLVAAGYVYAQVTSFPRATTDDTVISRYRNLARFVLVPFWLALLDSGSCMWWLLQRSDHLYVGTLIGFGLSLSATGAYGSILILKYL